MKVEKLQNYEVTCLDCGSKLSFDKSDIFEKIHESKQGSVPWGYLVCPCCMKEIHVRYEKEFCDKVRFRYSSLDESCEKENKMTNLDALNANIEKLVDLLSSISNIPSMSELVSQKEADEVSEWLNETTSLLNKDMVRYSKTDLHGNTSSLMCRRALLDKVDLSNACANDYIIPNYSDRVCTLSKKGRELLRGNDVFPLLDEILCFVWKCSRSIMPDDKGYEYQWLPDIWKRGDTRGNLWLVDIDNQDLKRALSENLPDLDVRILTSGELKSTYVGDLDFVVKC